MIDLVLDDLRGETSECGMALAELAIRIRDLNALEFVKCSGSAGRNPDFLFVGNNDVPFISRIDIRRCGSSPMKGNDQ